MKQIVISKTRYHKFKVERLSFRTAYNRTSKLKQSYYK